MNKNTRLTMLDTVKAPMIHNLNNGNFIVLVNHQLRQSIFNRMHPFTGSGDAVKWMVFDAIHHDE